MPQYIRIFGTFGKCRISIFCYIYKLHNSFFVFFVIFVNSIYFIYFIYFRGLLVYGYTSRAGAIIHYNVTYYLGSLAGCMIVNTFAINLTNTFMNSFTNTFTNCWPGWCSLRSQDQEGVRAGVREGVRRSVCGIHCHFL